MCVYERCEEKGDFVVKYTGGGWTPFFTFCFLFLQRWCLVVWRVCSLPTRGLFLQVSSSWWAWSATTTTLTRSSRASPRHRCLETTWTPMVSITHHWICSVFNTFFPFVLVLHSIGFVSCYCDKRLWCDQIWEICPKCCNFCRSATVMEQHQWNLTVLYMFYDLEAAIKSLSLVLFLWGRQIEVLYLRRHKL